VRELVWDLLNSRLSRRGFVAAMVAAGYTRSAAQSALQSLAPSASDKEGVLSLTRAVTGTGADIMAEQLTDAGVHYLFVACTSGLGPLCDALVTRPQIQLIQGTHEGIVVAVASGYAMASGKPGFAMFAGEGLPNACSNFYNSMRDRTPLVVMTVGGEGGREEDFSEAVKPFTKLRMSCTDASKVPDAIHTATKTASVLPGGPTQIRFSERALRQKNSSASVFSAKAFEIPMQLRPDSKDVEQAARLLLNSTSPLMLVGSEVTACGAMASMVKLAELLGMPVESAKTWGADFPSFHPMFIGKEALQSGGYRYPKSVDCFLNFGARFPTSTRLASGTPIIRASVDPQSIGRGTSVSVMLIGHLDLVARQLIEAIQGMATAQQIEARVAARRGACSAFTKATREARFAMARKAAGDPIPWYRAMVELNDLLDKDAVVVPEIDDDVQVTNFLDFGDDAKLKIGRTTGSALGWGVAAAAGVKLALPNRQVMSFQGDGGFLFGQGESLWTMSRYDLPVLIVIHNNQSYEIPRWHIMQAGASGDARRDYVGYLGDPDVDFARLASAFSIKGETVRNTDQLRPAIQRGIKSLKDGRPYLLDMRTKPVGIGADASWYPKFSLASTRTRKV
jgi:thiamine pyrophosphate-dependent acetolactate synthase large subunit-like protein